MSRVGFKGAIEEAAQAAERDPSTGQFTKGHARKGGRPPGGRNRVSRDAKDLMDKLVMHGLRTACADYDRVKGKAPSRALQVLARFAEYRLPKLARTEVTGGDGGPVVIERVVTRLVQKAEEEQQLTAKDVRKARSVLD